jgi:hypothetical protein
MLRWLTRFSLIAALVLSQALYAGHSISHVNGDQVDCHICLQASSGGAALVSGEIGPPVSIHAAPPVCSRLLPVAITTLPNSHPTRAPPFLTL